MMGDYSEQLWNLDQVHDLIERDPAAGGREAVKKIVNDVRAITDKISEDAEKVMAGIHVEADVMAAKLKAAAKKAADAIR